MEVEMRESYRALKGEMVYINNVLSTWNLYRATWKGKATNKETEMLLRFVAAVDSVIEAIDVYQSDVDYILWMDKIIEIIKPAYDKLIVIPEMTAHHDEIMKVQKIVGLINIKRGVHDPNQQLFFLYYVFSKLMNDIKVARDSVSQNDVHKSISNKPGKNKRPPIKVVDSMTLLTPIGKRVLGGYETILKDKIPLWEKKKHGALVQCAAFCDYLHLNNMIKKGDERVKICSQFAWNKYGIDIRIQLEKDSDIRDPNIEKIAKLLGQG